MESTNPFVWLTSAGTEYTGKVIDINEKKGTAKYQVPHPCGRCGGAGGGEQWKHTGYKCYECGGSGYRDRTKELKLYSPAAYAKMDAARQKRSAASSAKKAAEAARRAEEKKERDRIRLEEIRERNARFRKENPDLEARLSRHIARDGFLSDIHAKLQEYGYLSPAQVNAAVHAIEKYERESRSEWIGVIGKRMIMTLTVDRVIMPEEPRSGFCYFPQSWTYLCHDPQGNRVVYRGRSNAMPCTGETATLVVGVFAHSEYRGIKQTSIERPRPCGKRAAAKNSAKEVGAL